LSLSSFCTSDRTQSICGSNSPDGAGGEAGLENVSVRTEGKIGRVNDTAAFFPVSADFVGIFRYFQAVTNGKSRSRALDHFCCLIQRIYGKRDDLGVLLFEFLKVSLVIGYLPNAVGSPDAPIENDHGVFRLDIGGNIACASIDRWYGVVRKGITGS
jgi:hypothetical protein